MTTKKPTTRIRKTTVKSTSSKPKTVAVKKKEIPPNPMVHELLEAVDSERTKAKKVSLLKQHGDNAIKSMFIWNFDETVVSMLPSGDVPYQPVDSTQITNLGAGVANRSTIRNKADTFYNFVKGGNNGLNKVKRETMFIGLLESLHPSEADILILVKDKQLGTKYKVTRELVSEAYPDIQWGGRS
ncbi:MAG: hypothetical protein CL855_08360 [Cryomorphaceae bacterium]|nr:hypothetical protein [Cryomorphaceae bacterium]